MNSLSTMRKERKQTDYSSAADRWNAIVRRDQTADGKFYFAVKTTGVYCRPSCFARLPRLENVDFYESCEAAERAGFRACKRCKPKGLPLAEERAVKIAAACRAIENAEELPNLDQLAKIAGMSRYHFHRIFKTATGLTPKAFAVAHRSDRMREELSKWNTVTEAITALDSIPTVVSMLNLRKCLE
jgi:AraC family transcriptional regulator of adaptative response/methylated-DNA-[protein]-cysteine methyltransferase